MGTNFYLMSKSKKLMRENFAVENDYGITDEEYEIVDEPYLGYQVHLNKLSCGWWIFRPQSAPFPIYQSTFFRKYRAVHSGAESTFDLA